jgi:hypothetical protein
MTGIIFHKSPQTHRTLLFPTIRNHTDLVPGDTDDALGYPVLSC